MQIEGNSFSEAKVTNVINGKTVLGTMREIEEVKGAIEAYEYLEKYDYKKEKDLLYAHKLLMANLLNNAGAYRYSNVGVGVGCRKIAFSPYFNYSFLDYLKFLQSPYIRLLQRL